MPAFAVNARYVLLTYSQCGQLDGFSVMDRISELGAECIVGREYHADGGIHLHVFCDFGRKFRSRKTDLFDVGGYHPNIEKIARTPSKAYDYAIKDGDVICGGAERPAEAAAHGSKTADKWSEITSAEDREEFWELVHRLDPKAAACSFTSLAKYCDWKFAVDPPEYATPGGIEFDTGEFDGRADWLRQSHIGLDEPLLGESHFAVVRGSSGLRPGGLLGSIGTPDPWRETPPFGGDPLRKGASGLIFFRQMSQPLFIRGISNWKNLVGKVPGTPHIQCGPYLWNRMPEGRRICRIRRYTWGHQVLSFIQRVVGMSGIRHCEAIVQRAEVNQVGQA